MDSDVAAAGPVRPAGSAAAALRPVPGAAITGGFWAARRVASFEPGLLGGVTVVHGVGRCRVVRVEGWWPCRSGTGSGTGTSTATGTAELTEPLSFLPVPYYAWASRHDGAMRIWLPMV